VNGNLAADSYNNLHTSKHPYKYKSN